MRHLEDDRNSFEGKSNFPINATEILEQFFNDELEIDIEMKIEEKLMEDDNFLDKYLEVVESSDEIQNNTLSEDFTDNFMDIIKGHKDDEVKFHKDNDVYKKHSCHNEKNSNKKVQWDERTTYKNHKRNIESIFAKKKASNIQVYDNNKELQNVAKDKKVITYEEIQKTIRRNKRVNKIIYYASVACIGGLFMVTGMANNMLKSVYEIDNPNTTRTYLNIESGWSDRLTSETSRIIQSLVK